MRKFVLLAATVSLLWSCRKDDTVLVNCLPAAQPSDPLQAFFYRNGAARQVFTINLDRQQVLTTRAGATITIPPYSFVLPTGQRATGQAEFRVRELYTVPDMLLADRPTNDPTTLLMSGGEFMLQAWQGTSRLRLSSSTTSSQMAISLQSPAPQNPDTAVTRFMTTWSLALPAATWTNTYSPVTRSWSTTGPGQGIFQCTLPLDTLSWWNIDQLWNNNPLVPRFTAEFSFDTDHATTTISRVWLKPTNANAIFGAYPITDASGATVLDRAALPNTPEGSFLTAIVLQSRADGLYYGTQPATVAAGQIPHVTLTKMSEADIVSAMRQF